MRSEATGGRAKGGIERSNADLEGGIFKAQVLFENLSLDHEGDGVEAF